MWIDATFIDRHVENMKFSGHATPIKVSGRGVVIYAGGPGAPASSWEIIGI